jgi:hypothetical protein
MSGLILPKSARTGRRRMMDSASVGMTYDRETIDGTGAFLVGELERLDMTLHDPLVSVSWFRDIMLREDVTIADELSSFTNSSFSAPGGIIPGGKAWISKDSNSISGVGVDIGKTLNPLYLWGVELSWTLPELLSSQQIGRPIDTQKYNALKLRHQMEIDEQVYIGDTTFGKAGLVNSAAVAQSNVVAGASGGYTWNTKSPDEILADVNTLLTATWTASGFAVMPTKLLLPPLNFSYLVSEKVSLAGNNSILTYLKENSISLAATGMPLDIQPVKWLTGRGVSGTNRMVAYTNDMDRVRFPMVPLQRTPIEYRSIFQMTTYFGRLGVVEFVYPETLSYADGI